MATLRTRYVNTASTAGGDGTTNGTAGATRAYASLNAAIAAEVIALPGLVAADTQLDIVVTGGSDTTTGGGAVVTVTGWTTDATRYVRIVAASGQEAQTIWKTDRYRLSPSLGFHISQNYTVLDQIQVETTADDNNLDVVLIASANAPVTVRRCHLRHKPQVYTAGDSSSGINSGSDNTGDRFLSNNVIEVGTRAAAAGVYGIFCDNHLSGKTYAYNNTVICNTTTGAKGVLDGSAVVEAKNMLVSGFGGGDFVSMNSGHCTNCASSDGTAVGTAARTGQTFTFVGGGDYAITSSDAGARDHGADLSADSALPFAIDIVGTSRPQGSAWDIGAFEAAGGTNATVTPTGIGMTSSLGTPTVTKSGVQVSPIGFGMTASLGTPVVGVSVIPTGIGMTMSLGTFSIQNDITLLAVGFGMTASLGTPTRVVAKPVSGIGMTMSLGTPTMTGNPTLVPTGLGMTSSLGTPTVTHGSNPTIVPTGVSMTFTLGTPSVSTFQQVTVTPTGFGMVSSLGSPTVSTGNITILLLGDTKQLNTSVRARQLVTTPIVRRPRG